MRDNVKTFVRAFAETFDVQEPVYEFGALQVGPPGYANLRPLFSGRRYVGCDMSDGPGVDRIEDLECLSLGDNSIGTAICVDTLEHVFPLFKAFDEMFRVLIKNGSIVVSSVMDFWIHSHPHDYWRFTPQAFESLLRPYPLKIVGYQGLKDFPHTVYGVAFKSYDRNLEQRCERFCQRMEHDLRLLEAETWRANSLNGKFKAIRKKLSYKVFGPKSEYTKMLQEYDAQWTILGPSTVRHEERSAVR